MEKTMIFLFIILKHSECNNEIGTMTCSASTEYSSAFSCQKAIDGKVDTDWATAGKGTGSWIQLNFGEVYKIETIKIKHRSTGGLPESEMFKDLSLEFSDGQKVDFRLNNVPFTSGLVWNEIIFPNNPVSDYVKITATSVYSTINNGFSDIRVYGCAEGNFLVILEYQKSVMYNSIDRNKEYILDNSFPF